MAIKKILVSPETKIRWQDSGADEVMTLASLGASAGQNGALHDFGAAPRASRYHYKFRCQFNTVPVVGETVDLYIREASLETSATDPTNDDGTGDVALSSTDKLRNLLALRSLAVDEAATAGIMSVEGIFETAARHFGPVVFNAAADILHATAANNYFEVTPIPDEIQ